MTTAQHGRVGHLLHNSIVRDSLRLQFCNVIFIYRIYLFRKLFSQKTFFLLYLVFVENGLGLLFLFRSLRYDYSLKEECASLFKFINIAVVTSIMVDIVRFVSYTYILAKSCYVFISSSLTLRIVIKVFTAFICVLFIVKILLKKSYIKRREENNHKGQSSSKRVKIICRLSNATKFKTQGHWPKGQLNLF